MSMAVSIHVMILGIDQILAERMLQELRHVGFAPDWVLLDSEHACAEYIDRHGDTLDAILVDAALRRIDLAQIVRSVQAHERQIPIVVVAEGLVGELPSQYLQQSISGVLPPKELKRLGSLMVRAQRQRFPEGDGRVLAAFDVLAGLVERLPLAIAVVAPDGTIQYLNQSFSRLSGYAGDAAIHMTLDRLVAGRLNPELWKQIVEAVASNGEWRGEVHGQTKMGEVYQAVMLVTPIQSAGGPATGYLVLCHDITEQTRMMNALRVSEQRFQALVQAAPLAIVAHDQDGSVTIWNPAAERIFGWRADEAIGRMYVDLTVPEHARAEHFTLRDRALRGESTAGVEARRLKQDGTLIDVSLSTAALHDAHGAIAGVMAVIADVTDHKRAMTRLQQSEERFRRLIENASDVLSILDADAGDILYESPSAARVLGYPPEEMIGQNVFAFVHPDDLAHIRQVFGSLLERPRLPLKAEARFRRREGSWAYLEAIGRYAPELGGVVVNSWDVTERKQVEDEVRALNADLEQRVAERTRELAAANERLKELDRLRSKFVSDVSHDLRSPLATMHLHLGLLERGRPEKRDQYLATLKTQINQLIELVEDILDLSRLEREKEAAAFGPIDLNVVAERVVTANRLRAEAAGLELVFEPAANLPAITGAHDLLARLIANLISNAINYTPGGQVRIRTFREDGHVGLQVADTGLGIDSDDLPHVFERFYRGRRARKSDVAGTGLGLGIVKEIASLHGGNVHAESTVGRGSTFTVEFPHEAEIGDVPMDG